MSWNYERDDSGGRPKTGKQRCVIVDVEEAVSKASHKPMIVVTVQPSGSKARVKYYIVQNEHFNRNMTQFFDAFPSIREGDFNFLTWVGAMGAADFGEDENGYLKVKWWLDSVRAEGLPEWEGEKPEQQQLTELEDEDEDDLPFM